MKIATISLDGEFPITVPVADHRWNGWAIPYLTADEVRAFGAWAAEGDSEFAIWIGDDGNMCEASVDEMDQPAVTLPTIIDGAARFDVSGYVWFEDDDFAPCDMCGETVDVDDLSDWDHTLIKGVRVAHARLCSDCGHREVDFRAAERHADIYGA